MFPLPWGSSYFFQLRCTVALFSSIPSLIIPFLWWKIMPKPGRNSPCSLKVRNGHRGRHKQHTAGFVPSEWIQSPSKRGLRNASRGEARRFKNGKPCSKRTLREVFHRTYAEHSEEPYIEQHPLTNTDIIKINSLIRQEIYDAKRLQDGCRTGIELKRKFPNFLRYLRKEIEKTSEILERCVAQWGWSGPFREFFSVTRGNTRNDWQRTPRANSSREKFHLTRGEGTGRWE